MERNEETLRWMQRELQRAGVEAGIDVEDGQVYGTYFSIVREEPEWSPVPVYSVYPNDAAEFDTSVAIRGGESVSEVEAVELTVKRFGPPPSRPAASEALLHAQTLGSLMDGQEDDFATLLRPIRDHLITQALVRELRDAIILCGIDYIEADSFSELHSLRDANEFLMDAWRTVFDADLDAGDESQCAIINRAVDAYDARYGGRDR